MPLLLLFSKKEVSPFPLLKSVSLVGTGRLKHVANGSPLEKHWKQELPWRRLKQPGLNARQTMATEKKNHQSGFTASSAISQ